MNPRVSAVGGPVNSVARGKVRAAQTFPAADVNDVRVGGRDGQGADRSGGLPIEYRSPGPPGIRAFPHAAVVYADVKKIWFAGNASGANRAASAEWADAAPF